MCVYVCICVCSGLSLIIISIFVCSRQLWCNPEKDRKKKEKVLLLMYTCKLCGIRNMLSKYLSCWRLCLLLKALYTLILPFNLHTNPFNTENIYCTLCISLIFFPHRIESNFILFVVMWFCAFCTHLQRLHYFISKYLHVFDRIWLYVEIDLNKREKRKDVCKCQTLPNTAKYYQILPNITKYYQILPNIAKSYCPRLCLVLFSATRS